MNFGGCIGAAEEAAEDVDQAKAPAGVRAKVEERDKAAGGSLDQLTN